MSSLDFRKRNPPTVKTLLTLTFSSCFSAEWCNSVIKQRLSTVFARFDRDAPTGDAFDLILRETLEQLSVEYRDNRLIFAVIPELLKYAADFTVEK